MFEKQIIDKQEHRNFFVMMSNRDTRHTFPMLTDDPSTIIDRAYEEISMGYTGLLIYKRMAILQQDSFIDLSKTDEGKAKHYRNFLFIQQHEDSEYVAFSAFEPPNHYETLDEAIAAGKEQLKNKQRIFPGQVFTVVCSAFLENHAWH